MPAQAFVEKKKQGSKKSKKAQLNRQEEKALGWGGWDDKLDPKKCTVVLKRLFTPDELLADPKAVPELEEDISTARLGLGVARLRRVPLRRRAACRQLGGGWGMQHGGGDSELARPE